MADERTPLLAVVQTRPHRDRYSHHTLRNVCTIGLSLLLLIGGIAAIVVLTLVPLDDDDTSSPLSTYLPWSAKSVPPSWPKTQGLDFEGLQAILLTTPDAEKAREWSQYYTSGPHLAGKNLSQAIWTKEKWQEFGIENSLIVNYDIYVNYPLGHRLALLGKTKDSDNIAAPDTEESEWEVKYEASLEEDVLEEDHTSGLKDRIPTFHGYSASGNVTAPYVYVNYGTYRDFEELLLANVSLSGKIALIKYGGVFRGLKVKRAQELGMVGAVIYTDPGDDGDVTEKNGHATYPAGPARNPSSVQRGSTQFLSFAPGDPTTPGYPSKPGAPRQPVDHAIPSIPSIPISYQDALPLLKALNGHGPKASEFNKYWKGGGLGYKGVEYNIGPSPDDLVLNLVNEQEYVTTPMWNVIGVINGTIPDEVVVLGNHRDAWIAGGAGDPNSGSAAFNELIRSFGIALEAGWKPFRTVVFASWDGEEYGLLGSTEWVEEYIPWLQATTVAYLNVDVGANGPNFRLSAAPLLEKVVVDTIGLVPSPNQTIPKQTVKDTWNGHISTMGSGSDFTAFQDFAGIPSIDMGFGFDSKSAVYHYHSNYDSFDWMEKFGDPGFQYHATIAEIWGLVAAKLIETPVLQLSAADYAAGLRRYVNQAKQKAEYAGNDRRTCNAIFEPLENAVYRFTKVSNLQDSLAAELSKQLEDDDIPWWKWWEKVRLWMAVRKVNTKYKLLERQFLYAEGLDGRPWFKHIVFAPGKWTGYAGATFPGIVEAIDDNDKNATYRWIGIATEIVEKAAEFLEDE
ncbi:N-acetylated-alpha-linked acidic dipeptidase-like protein [Lophiotrema nucula]|uniref:N-acetylated-alpha-linked acidic dipeptidase-like protein n=1 Tax=Lophiotrema nucula TaxID=690887 RepID=A0A6A5YUM7_9PLEO|nr:N-acetylated-alpha-linked acidic dipeptidase-like protein [Lophiotrema nucula]